MAAPIANAGPDQTLVSETWPTATIRLDGSASTDPDFTIAAQGITTHKSRSECV